MHRLAALGPASCHPPGFECLLSILTLCRLIVSFMLIQLTKSAVTHKATKRALSQLMESLGDELREAGLTSIGVHNLSPGGRLQCWQPVQHLMHVLVLMGCCSRLPAVATACSVRRTCHNSQPFLARCLCCPPGMLRSTVSPSELQSRPHTPCCPPGMLLTDLLLKDSTPVSRRFFNALAEEPETVAAVIVPQASISWCRTTGLA